MKDISDSNISLGKILVTGGKGTMASYAPSTFNSNTVLLAGKDTMDITNKASIHNTITTFKPNLIIHLAALTDVDFCETHPDLAEKVNFEGTKNIAEICKKNSIPLVYVSTAAVFDGINPPSGGYTEMDTPKPINVYAKTKLQGEEIVEKLLSKYIIVRVGWLVGGGKTDKKFISYILDKIKKGETIKAVNDRFGTIAYGKDVMRFIKEKIEQQEYGLYHFACYGKCSRFDIANVLKEMVNPNTEVIPVDSSIFKDGFPAPRPKLEILTSIKSSFKEPWQKTLHQYIKQELL